MNIQMRLITSDNIENLTSYGKHSLGNLNKFIERAENFVEVEKEKETKVQSCLEKSFKKIIERKRARRRIVKGLAIELIPCI
jgi:flagellar biosynthesis chaperone FliJ